MKESYYHSAEHYVRCLAKTAKSKQALKAFFPTIAVEIYNYDMIVKPSKSLCTRVFFEIYNLDNEDSKETNEQELKNILHNAMEEIRPYKDTELYANSELERVYTKEYTSFRPDQDYGVYFIYDKDDNIIYIGKSEFSLKGRAFESLKYKKGRKVQYHYPKTKADTGVYELYFINKHKPVHNRDSKTEDSITIELPVIKCSEIIKPYAADCVVSE